MDSSNLKYPLRWPIGWERTKKPTLSNFGKDHRPSIYKANSYLKDQLRLFKAKSVIVSSNLRLKIDGEPYSRQKPLDDNGVAVYFVWNNTDCVIACDTFLNPGCNIWAVAKTIDALRLIDRYKCTEILNRAFSGFKALPEKGTETKQQLSPWQILDLFPGASQKAINRAYRAKAKQGPYRHPDNGGSSDMFFLLREAYNHCIQFDAESPYL